MGANKWPIFVVVISLCIISPVVLQHHETWFLTLKKEHTLHGVLRNIYTQEWGSGNARQ